MEKETIILKGKIISFILDDPYYYCNSYWYSSNPLVRFLGELTYYFKKVYISAPVLNSNKISNKYFLCSNEAIIAKRSFYKNRIDFLKKLPILLPFTFLNIYKIIKLSDIIVIRLPCIVSPIVFFLNNIYSKNSKKIICYVAGNLLERRKKVKRFGIMEDIIQNLLNIYINFEKFLVKQYPTVFLGRALIKNYEKVNPYHMFFSMNLIKRDEIFYRIDTCQNDTIKLLYVGNLEKEKGLDILLLSLKYLKNKKINFILNLAGEGPYRSFLEKEARRLGLINKINFLESIMFGKDLFQEYRSADIFILPSLSEGVPKVLFEAMAFGLPIVATKVGGIPDIIKHLKNGYLVDPNNSLQLAEGIITFIKNAHLRKKVIQNNYTLIENYALEKQVEKFCNFIAKICVEF